MKAIVFSVLLGMFLFMGGCAATMTPATGFIYTDAKGPMMVTAEKNGSKQGTAMCKSILGWVASGDCSIEAAMANGGITKVTSVDYKTTNILGVYATITTIVHGE